MKRLTFWGMVVCCLAVMLGTVAAAEDWVVGEKWTYKHDGPMPFRSPDETIQGDHVREVVSIQGEGEKKRWLLQEKWGDYDDQVATRYVDQKKMSDKMDFGDNTSRIDPAYPVEFTSLKPGEEKTYEAKFQMGEEFSFPISLTAKRLENETLKVPAGEFENCTHVKIGEKITFSRDGEEQEFRIEREHWYHPKANGLVKETFVYFMGGEAGPKGISVLKSHTKGK